jgi:SAM-dependent methyltransferase
MTACVICGSETRRYRDEIEDYEYGVPWKSALQRCPDCGLICQSPPVRPDEIPGLYPENYLAHSAASKSRSVYGWLKGILARRTARKLTRRLPTRSRLLEIGCGNGAFLKTIGEVRGDVDRVGIDIKRIEMDAPGVEFHEGQLETIDLPAASLDLIYCSNLIEHVPDPVVFLDRCFELLKPGGILYGITPNHASLDRWIFGRYWGGYHYPRHTFVFDHSNLEQLLHRCGFGAVKLSGGYGFWYVSLTNRFLGRAGSRGFLFAAVTAAFLPLDWAINGFRPHGSMTFVARRD